MKGKRADRALLIERNQAQLRPQEERFKSYREMAYLLEKIAIAQEWELCCISKRAEYTIGMKVEELMKKNFEILRGEPRLLGEWVLRVN